MKRLPADWLTAALYVALLLWLPWAGASTRYWLDPDTVLAKIVGAIGFFIGLGVGIAINHMNYKLRELRQELTELKDHRAYAWKIERQLTKALWRLRNQYGIPHDHLTNSYDLM